MSYGIKMDREPQMDTSAPEVEDYEEGDAIRALGFIAAIKDGHDLTYRNRNGTRDWPISSFLSDRSAPAQIYLFWACTAALRGHNENAISWLRRYIEQCAQEFGQETE